MNYHNAKQPFVMQTIKKSKRPVRERNDAQRNKFRDKSTKIEGPNKKKKHHINLRSQDTKTYDFLSRKNEAELLGIIFHSNVKPLQKAAIEELARRAESGSLSLFDSYVVIIKYSENTRARNALVENINKPTILKWIIENCPYEDTREFAKNRLTLVLNRPKV